MNHSCDMQAFAAKLSKIAPVECEFKIGDKVTFTNENGVKFHGKTVIGFADNANFYGRFIHLDSDCYWFASKPEELTLDATDDNRYQ